MRSIAFILAAILFCLWRCGGVVKENSEKKTDEQPFSSKNDYGLGEKGYPNPFSPKAGINFTLDKADSVKIEIFTVEGDTVGVVADGFFDEGDHFVSLDNIDLESGIYFFEIATSDSVMTRKMTLLR